MKKSKGRANGTRLTCYEDCRVCTSPREQWEHRYERISVNGGPVGGRTRNTNDLREQNAARNSQHLTRRRRRPALSALKHTQRLRRAHEYVSLAHVDVADLFEAGLKLDRLHQQPRAHVVQECAVRASAEERRVGESVRAGDYGEGQLGPRSEMTARAVAASGCRRRRRLPEERICPLLLLVRWRMGGGHLAVGKITGQAPDFLLSIIAVKDEISVFVLAVGIGANVMLVNAAP